MSIEYIAAGANVALHMAAHHDIDRECAVAKGWFFVVCHDADGTELWREEFPNVVTTVGKNIMLQTLMTGSAYSVTGPFIGLISSVSFSAVAATDTMSSHPGWTESDSTHAPAYTVSSSANRATAVFGTAASGSIAITNIVFTMTGSGTVEGAFVTLGSGAVNTWENTGGTLYSAGTFGTPQPVVGGNTITLSYSTSLT